MQKQDFKTKIGEILLVNSKFKYEAYEFVNDAVIFTVKVIEDKNKSSLARHISAIELINGVKIFAQRKFGPLAFDVLESWGVVSPISIGEIVFNMIEKGLLSKTGSDRIEDFNIQSDLSTDLSLPYLAANDPITLDIKIE